MLKNRLHDLKIDSDAQAAAQEAGENQFQDEDIIDMQNMIGR